MGAAHLSNIDTGRVSQLVAADGVAGRSWAHVALTTAHQESSLSTALDSSIPSAEPLGRSGIRNEFWYLYIGVTTAVGMAEPHEKQGGICFPGKRQDNHLDLTWKGTDCQLVSQV